MPNENQGSQAIEENQKKSQNIKSQDTIQNELYLEREEETRAQKEELNNQEKEWIEKEKENDNRQNETLNQREFFNGLLKDLKAGKITSKDTIGFEEVEEKTAEEISNMDSHSFNVWVERNQFAQELNQTRKNIEKNQIANAIAKKIEKEREGNWAKKVELMTPSERAVFDKTYLKALNELD